MYIATHPACGNTKLHFKTLRMYLPCESGHNWEEISPATVDGHSIFHTSVFVGHSEYTINNDTCTYAKDETSYLHNDFSQNDIKC